MFFPCESDPHSDRRVFSRTTKTSVRDFCDISYLLAGPDRSHQATTEGRIGRKPRKFRDKFESIQSPAKTFYNNDLSVAVDAVCCEPVSAPIPCLTGKIQGIFAD